jgi:hypothetical protein
LAIKAFLSRFLEHFFAVLPFRVLEKIVDKPLRILGVAMAVGMCGDCF